MEQKFKIGDKVEVADGHKGVIVDEIYNQITGRLFSVDCGENGFGQYKASALTLIEPTTNAKETNDPLPIFEENDLVEYDGEVYEFLGYKGRLGCMVKNYHGGVMCIPKLRATKYTGAI